MERTPLLNSGGRPLPARREGRGAARVRANAVPQKASRGADRLFRYLLSLYVMIGVVKIHDAFPAAAALSPAKLAGGALLLSAFFVLTAKDVRMLMRSRQMKWVAVIVVLSVLSVPFSLWPGYSANFLLNDYSRVLILYAIASMGMTRQDVRRAVLMAFVLATSFMAARVTIGGAPEMVGRAYVGSGFDPNESAVLFLTALALIPAAAQRRSRWLRAAFILVALILVAGVVRTGSRTGFIGLLVLPLWLTATAPRGRRWPVLVGVTVGVVAFAATATSATWERFGTVFAPEQDYNYTARDGRIELWKRGAKYMMARPLLGVGVNAFSVAEGTFGLKKNVGFGLKYSAAHNAFVQIGAELGVFGLLAFIMLLYASWRTCWGRDGKPPHLPSRPGDIAGIGKSVAGAFLMVLLGSFFLSLAFHPLTYFVLSLCTSMGLEAAAQRGAVASRRRPVSVARRRGMPAGVRSGRP